jgi:type VI protein secretion system component Hcp
MPLGAFMKIDTIPGECESAGHEGWIELTDFKFEIGEASLLSDEDESSDSDGGVPKAPSSAKRPKRDEGKFKSVSCSKNIDKSSPMLFKSCAKNDATAANTPLIPEVIIHLSRHAGGTNQTSVTYVSFTFKKCNIKSISVSTSGEELPKDQFEFTYEQVSFKYIETSRKTGQAVGGSPARFAWDVNLNKEWAGAPA